LTVAGNVSRRRCSINRGVSTPSPHHPHHPRINSGDILFLFIMKKIHRASAAALCLPIILYTSWQLARIAAAVGIGSMKIRRDFYYYI